MKFTFLIFLLFKDDFSNYEANDPWVQNYILQIDNMLATFKVSIIDHVYAFINMRACIFRTCITELFQNLIESSLSIQFITVQIILTECSLHGKL